MRARRRRPGAACARAALPATNPHASPSARAVPRRRLLGRVIKTAGGGLTKVPAAKLGFARVLSKREALQALRGAGGGSRGVAGANALASLLPAPRLAERAPSAPNAEEGARAGRRQPVRRTARRTARGAKERPAGGPGRGRSAHTFPPPPRPPSARARAPTWKLQAMSSVPSRAQNILRAGGQERVLSVALQRSNRAARCTPGCAPRSAGRPASRTATPNAVCKTTATRF